MVRRVGRVPAVVRMLILVPPTQWEIREEGVLGMVGSESITIHLDVTAMQHYEVRYKGKRVAQGSYAALPDAKARAMMLPAVLLDFGIIA